MTTAVVPLKSLDRAKSRLVPVLGEAQRRNLALTMADDVISRLVKSGLFHRIILLAGDENCSDLAHCSGLESWRDQDLGIGADDTGPDRLRRVVASGLSRLAAQGNDSVFIIAGDLPTLQLESLTRIIMGSSASVRLCQAARDGGTNALYLEAPMLIPVQFGSRSADRHRNEAIRCGTSFESMPCPEISRDIDLPQDLDWLVHAPYACRSRKLAAKLSRHGPVGLSGKAE
jgi:2-phospho-L-lactate guanylyltransferase